MVLETFRRKNDESVVPSKFTDTGILSVFVVMRDLNNGRIIHGFAMKMGMIQCGDHDGTLRLLDRMLGTGIQPDLVTVTTILPTCSHLAALMHGREIHGYMIVSGLGKDGNSDVLPQIRDQYQLDFPTLSTESDYLWLTIPN
ncbi:Pentatricopeptide repeat-containing protein [Vitis vinifera]|uniref:Pentatricopeptide repeat-containing protein n=1 Tax=Vitis vinifera TaxID=29760 RepID=A0A438HIP0_VITVI|nr:Pentatricopeptide repeat-containing protein [Vitis vinifera]